MLRVEGIEAGYGEIVTLWGVDLEIAAGTITGLLGPNGAGKTTLVRTITGLVKARAGSVRIDDVELTHVPAHRIVEHGVAAVPEGRRLFAGMNVEENLLAGAYSKRRDTKHVADELAAVYAMFPRLAERRTQLTGDLSGGEQQMCAIGRALMSRPKVLLVDELSLGLAPMIVDRIIETLVRVAASGVAVLVIDQDADLVLQSSSNAYVMNHGRIVLHGPSATVRAEPQLQDALLGLLAS